MGSPEWNRRSRWGEYNAQRRPARSGGNAETAVVTPHLRGSATCGEWWSRGVELCMEDDKAVEWERIWFVMRWRNWRKWEHATPYCHYDEQQLRYFPCPNVTSSLQCLLMRRCFGQSSLVPYWSLSSILACFTVIAVIMMNVGFDAVASIIHIRKPMNNNK